MSDVNKIKEPAPSANGTSPKNNNPICNDSTDRDKSQDVLTKYIKCSDAIGLAHSDVKKQGLILNDLVDNYVSLDKSLISCFIGAKCLKEKCDTPEMLLARKIILEIDRLMTLIAIADDYSNHIKKTLEDSGDIN